MSLHPCTEHTLDYWFVKGNFNDNDKKAVLADCVARYAKPQGCCNTLQWLIFRIWNAVKAALSCFGCCSSDWQKAATILREDIMPGVAKKTPAQIAQDTTCQDNIRLMAEKALYSLVRIQRSSIESEWTTKSMDFDAELDAVKQDVEYLFPQHAPSGAAAAAASASALPPQDQLKCKAIVTSVDQIGKKLNLAKADINAIKAFLIFCQNHHASIIRKAAQLLAFTVPREATTKDTDNKAEFHRLYKSAAVALKKGLYPTEGDKKAALANFDQSENFLISEWGHAVIDVESGLRQFKSGSDLHAIMQVSASDSKKVNLKRLQETVFKT